MMVSAFASFRTQCVWTRGARGGRPPPPFVPSCLLTRGERQVDRRRLAMTLDVVLGRGRVGIAGEPSGGSRRRRERTAILPRTTATRRRVERILEVRRQQVGDVGGVAGDRVDAVVLNAVILGGQLQGVHVRLGATFLGAVLHRDEVGNRDGGENADDDHDDHQLDERKALSVAHLGPFLLGVAAGTPLVWGTTATPVPPAPDGRSPCEHCRSLTETGPRAPRNRANCIVHDMASCRLRDGGGEDAATSGPP